MASAQSTLRVLVVDDHPVVREGIRAMLSSDTRIKTIDEASCGEEAIEKVNLLDPDVVLLDIRMPGMSGIEVTKRVKADRPNTAVIILTMYDNEMYVVEKKKNNKKNYLIKDSPREFLTRAIDAALTGGTMVKSGLLHQTIHGLMRTSEKSQEGLAEGVVNERFTPREFEVLRLVAQGYPNKQIAGELNLAQVTVKKYVQSVIAKLGVSDRTQAAIVAIRMGLISS